MKTRIPFLPLFIGVIATASFAQTQKPIVMTPPAVPDGSNWSRAPLPAARQFDDVKPADGLAIDQLPPNTPSSNIEAPIPPPRVAIMQPAGTAPAYVATTTTTTYVDPALTPTGRTTTVIVPTAAPAVEIRPAQRPVVEMTPPAVPNGSNWSRAPLPAKRPFDDMKAPDGQAIDQLPLPPATVDPR